MVRRVVISLQLSLYSSDIISWIRRDMERLIMEDCSCSRKLAIRETRSISFFASVFSVRRWSYAKRAVLERLLHKRLHVPAHLWS
jgi:hypothetical protein